MVKYLHPLFKQFRLRLLQIYGHLCNICSHMIYISGSIFVTIQPQLLQNMRPYCWISQTNKTSTYYKKVLLFFAKTFFRIEFERTGI